MDIPKRIELIARGAAEIIGLDEIEAKMSIDSSDSAVSAIPNAPNTPRTLNGYWGTAPTRSPSIGYLIPMLKFRDMIFAKIAMTVLIADLHAFLDKGTELIDRTDERVAYYTFLIKILLRNLGIRDNEYTIIRGSELQLKPDYMLDLLKMLTSITVNQAKRAGSDVVKQNKEPTLSSLIYPLMQTLDEKMLSADIELGGTDQRKIFMMSRDHVESIGHRKCAYVMNELLPSLGKPGSKMSSSDPNGKIGFLDTPHQIHEKIMKAYCVEKEVGNNPCLDLARLIIYPMGRRVGPHDTFSELLLDWTDGGLNARQFKEWVAAAVNDVVDPIRVEINRNIIVYNAAFQE